MAKVVWTDSAINNLNDIGEYISRDSVKYAEITVERPFNSVDILEKYPNAGKMTPELDDILTVHNCARMLGNTYDFGEKDYYYFYSAMPCLHLPNGQGRQACSKT